MHFLLLPHLWEEIFQHTTSKNKFFLRNEACTLMTDFLISGFECSLSLCLSLDDCLDVATDIGIV